MAQRPVRPSHTNSEIVSEQIVTGTLEEHGYRLVKMDQQWRHVHGVVEKDGEERFFKISSTPEVAERTRNEPEWNNQIGPLVEAAGIPMIIPRIHTTGEDSEGRFFYVADLYEGPTIGVKEKVEQPVFRKWVPRIIQAALFISSLKGLNFPLDVQIGNAQKGLQLYLERTERWASSPTLAGIDLSRMLEINREITSTYEPAVNHGDFTAYHMIMRDDKFVLIDGEHACSLTPRYYDVVYFFHRAFTVMGVPDDAKYFLTKFVEALEKEERLKFDSAMRPLLASRIVGGFLDESLKENKNEIDFTLHHQLMNGFLTNKLY